MTPPEISVIVPVYNRADDLQALLDDLCHQVGVTFEVVVVDDGSQTPIREAIVPRDYPYPITWCRHDTNQGAGTARNTALAASTAKLILFIDSDGRVRDPHCLQKHHDYQSGILPIPVAAKPPFVLHGHVEGIHHNYAGKTFYYSNWFMSMGKRWAIMRSTHAPTHNTSVPRAVFDRVGGFDPKFCLAEDADWSIRCVSAGIPLVYTPEISLGHRDRDSMADVLRGYTRMGEYSVQVRLKNPSSRYGFLFPRRRATATFLLPILVVLITVFIAWQCALKAPRGLLFLPSILLVNLAYGVGIWHGLSKRHGASAPGPRTASALKQSHPRNNLATIATLLLIVLLAFVLRLYRLDEQSTWFDEFNALLHDRTATLAEYLGYVKTRNPDHLPLYFILIFGWMKFLNGDVLGLRLISIAFGCLQIVPLFAFATRIYGRTAGLIAALCLAISPFQIYRHQSVRSDGFLGLMGAVSLYLTLVCASSRNWVVILLHATVNTLMAFTHLSTVGLIGLQFIYLAFAWHPKTTYALGEETSKDRRWGKISPALALWITLHVPIGLQMLLWFRSVNAGGVTWYHLPTLREWLNDLLGDVMVTANMDFIMTPLYFQLGDAAHRSTIESLCGAALAAFMAAALLWGACTLIHAWRTTRSRLGANPQSLLLLVAVGPVLALTLISLLWAPVAIPRYTDYASLALFTLLGGMLVALRPVWIRAIAILLIVGLYGVQLNLLLSNHARSDLLGAGEQIAARSRPGDVLLGMGLFPDGQQAIPNITNILLRNMPSNETVMFSARTLPGLVDQLVRCLGAGSPASTGRGWVLIEDWVFFPQRHAFETSLRAGGLNFNHWKSTNLHLYEVMSQRGDVITRPVAMATDLATGAEVNPYPSQQELLETFAPTVQDPAEREEVVAALRWAVPGLPLAVDPFAFFLVSLSAMELSPATGRTLAMQARVPTHLLNPKHLTAGLSYLAEGNPAAAAAEFSKIDPEQIIDYTEQLPGLLFLLQGDLSKAKGEMAADLRLNPGRLPAFFAYLCGITPPPCGSKLVPLP